MVTPSCANGLPTVPIDNWRLSQSLAHQVVVSALVLAFFNLWDRSFWSGPPSYIYADASMVWYAFKTVFTTWSASEAQAKDLEKQITTKLERLLKVGNSGTGLQCVNLILRGTLLTQDRPSLERVL